MKLPESAAVFTTLISTAELAARVGVPADPALVIVDVRHDLAHPDTWGENAYRDGHLPGARFAHVDRDLSGVKTGRNGRHPLPTPEDCARVFGWLGIDATKQVVTYDQGPGMYASRLWWMLRWLGHEAAAVLDGGFAAWTREGRPVTTEAPRISAASFVARAPATTVDARAIALNLAQPPVRPARRSRTRALSRRRRAARSCRRAHPRCDQSSLFREPRRGGAVQASPHARRGVRCDPRGPRTSRSRSLLRIGRHRLPQPARDDARGTLRGTPLPRLLERVVRRSRSTGGARRRVT